MSTASLLTGFLSSTKALAGTVEPASIGKIVEAMNDVLWSVSDNSEIRDAINALKQILDSMQIRRDSGKLETLLYNFGHAFCMVHAENPGEEPSGQKILSTASLLTGFLSSTKALAGTVEPPSIGKIVEAMNDVLWSVSDNSDIGDATEALREILESMQIRRDSGKLETLLYNFGQAFCIVHTEKRKPGEVACSQEVNDSEQAKEDEHEIEIVESATVKEEPMVPEGDHNNKSERTPKLEDEEEPPQEEPHHNENIHAQDADATNRKITRPSRGSPILKHPRFSKEDEEKHEESLLCEAQEDRGSRSLRSSRGKRSFYDATPEPPKTKRVQKRRNEEEKENQGDTCPFCTHVFTVGTTNPAISRHMYNHEEATGTFFKCLKCNVQLITHKHEEKCAGPVIYNYNAMPVKTNRKRKSCIDQSHCPLCDEELGTNRGAGISITRLHRHFMVHHTADKGSFFRCSTCVEFQRRSPDPVAVHIETSECSGSVEFFYNREYSCQRT